VQRDKTSEHVSKPFFFCRTTGVGEVLCRSFDHLYAS